MTRNNSSLLTESDDDIRQEINQYVAKINFSLAFVQTILSSSGVLANILVLIIINRKSLRNTSSSVFITYMSIFDSAVLILHAANLIRPRRNLFVHCSLTYLTDLFTFCANWTLVIITLERCIAVSSPFLAKRFCTVHSARFSIRILLAVGVGFFTTTFPIIHHTNASSHRRKCIIREKFVLFQRIYQPILFYGIPDILLLSNLYTLYLLIQRRKQQRTSAHDTTEVHITDVHSSRKQRQLTIMLVTVNLAFYLFTTPAMILYITEYSPPKHRDITKIKRSFLLSQISVVFLQLHNATNFLFYCFAGQRFRQATIQTIIKCSSKTRIFYYRRITGDKDYQDPLCNKLRNDQIQKKTNRISMELNYQRASNRAFTF